LNNRTSLAHFAFDDVSLTPSSPSASGSIANPGFRSSSASRALVSDAFVRGAGVAGVVGATVGVVLVADGVGVGVGVDDGVVLGVEAVSVLEPPQATRLSARPAMTAAERRVA
jgi:hypothetical protein